MIGEKVQKDGGKKRCGAYFNPELRDGFRNERFEILKPKNKSRSLKRHDRAQKKKKYCRVITLLYFYSKYLKRMKNKQKNAATRSKGWIFRFYQHFQYLFERFADLVTVNYSVIANKVLERYSCRAASARERGRWGCVCVRKNVHTAMVLYRCSWVQTTLIQIVRFFKIYLYVYIYIIFALCDSKCIIYRSITITRWFCSDSLTSNSLPNVYIDKCIHTRI